MVALVFFFSMVFSTLVTNTNDTPNQNHNGTADYIIIDDTVGRGGK